MKTLKYLSPTQTEITKLYPKGSNPEKEKIAQLYIEISKTTKKKKAAKGKGWKSLRKTKRERGLRLYNDLIKLGFWK